MKRVFKVGQRIYDDHDKRWGTIVFFPGNPESKVEVLAEDGLITYKPDNSIGECETTALSAYHIAEGMRFHGCVVCWEHNENVDYPLYCPEREENCFLSEIDNEEKRKVYRHIGYYNEVGDIRELAGKSAKEIVDYCNKGYGHFYEDKSGEEESDLDIAEEQNTIGLKITEDGKYAVIDQTEYWSDWYGSHIDNEDGDDSDTYIDIYELKTE